MRLVAARDITVADLPYISNPFFANSDVRSAYCGGFPSIHNLNEFVPSSLRNYQQGLDDLLRRIDQMDVCLVYSLQRPFSGIVYWKQDENHPGTPKRGKWVAMDTGAVAFSARMLVDYAYRKEMVFTDFQSPKATVSPLVKQDNLPAKAANETKSEETRILKDNLWKEHELLNQVAAAKQSKFYRKGNTTRPHSQGEEVKLIQTALRKMDIDIGQSGADGIYGQDAHDAVILFQENYQPTYAVHQYAWDDSDGIVGKNTLLVMDEALIAGWKYKEEQAQETPWMVTAKSQIGVKEFEGKESHPQIVEYYKAAKWRPVGSKKYSDIDDSLDSNAWCASFVAWVMLQHNYTIPKDAAAAGSWKNFGKTISEPVYGSIAVKRRNGGNHVAFVLGKSSDGKALYVIAGNQSNEVMVAKYPKRVWTSYVVPENYDETQQILPVYRGEAKNGGKEN